MKYCARRFSFAIALLAFSACALHLDAAAHLKVGANKRFLAKEDGSPFFYLGDTAWDRVAAALR